ncbi:hypothetical protein EC957_008008 [Mortierella hygrophila]|uniref:Uncharacterized protein n=1 Tax=Mortierella hygrophila TaxID=979708 RepID=A0A9P6FCG5_9FUNG|nr:hypothetical protein EC957_008008 [Mortierella hygrophila]
MEVVANTRGLDLTVGGHSHTYLGDPRDAMHQGPYPTLIKNLDEKETLIVQGKIVSYAGGPVLVDHSLSGDPNLLQKVDGWRSKFEAWSNKIFGTASDDIQPRRL